MNNKDVSTINPNIIIGRDYEGWLSLPAWKKFKCRNEAAGEEDPSSESDGIIKTHIIGTSVDYIHLLSQAQYDAIQYIKENDIQVRDALLNALLKEYSSAKSTYKELMPDITRIEDYQNHIELAFLHILTEKEGEVAKYGFELECTWDVEHGVGVMMYYDQVLQVGLAEAAFTNWPEDQTWETLEVGSSKV